MTSLSEQISELLDPGVKSVDPEDDIYEDTRARLVEKEDLDVAQDASQGLDSPMNVRGRRMQSLEGMGHAYQGKIVSRKNMISDSEDSGKGFEDATLNEESDIDEMSDQEIDDDTKINGIDESGEDVVDSLDIADSDGMDEEIDSDEAEGDDSVNIFKPTAVANPQSKGKSTRNQLLLWESMLESRIKCQKLLSISNRLPQHGIMEKFSSQSGKSLAAADKLLGTLLLKLLDLEAKLLAQNSQTRSIATSDSCRRKRKSSTRVEELDQDIEDRFKAMKDRRNKVLKLWYDKTRLTSTSGNSKSKSFSSFERSTISQIEDILQDKERLMKRTQLKRSEYRVLGKAENAPKDMETPNVETHSSHLKEFDEEIFDDDDFYHQLLRQLIEQKASGPGGTSDPVELTKQWLRIQRLRTKAKKNVDTKASKGRKIRYEIHQKLQSFMASNDRSTFTHEARNQLFKSLFGNIPDNETLPEF